MQRPFSVCLRIMTHPRIGIHNPLVLASTSPRRRKLLNQLGIPFDIISSRVQEGFVSGDPEHVSRHLAKKKSKQVYTQVQGSWILGADTLVVIDNRILGKPKGPEDVRKMLRLLSGKEHHVITGFCILDPSGLVAHSEAVKTIVRFSPLNLQEIDDYIATGEPFGKAGSYAIQGIGAFMVESISGSYTNVVGLPLCAVVKALLCAGALERFPIHH